MTEEFLHYIWRTKQVSPQMKSTKNEPIQILDFGIHNQDAGPDFQEAIVEIDGNKYSASGPSKKEAQKNVARCALDSMPKTL